MNIKQLVVERLPGFGTGAARIPGWVDGRTTAVIRWSGFAAKGQFCIPGYPLTGKEFVRRLDSERAAMQSVTAIHSYMNLYLISALLHVEDPELPEPGELTDPALD